jgi:hypothetical protein
LKIEDFEIAIEILEGDGKGMLFNIILCLDMEMKIENFLDFHL